MKLPIVACLTAIAVALVALVHDGRASVRSDICAVFQSRCAKAIAVAWCESRLNPWTIGRHGEIGLFQIHPVHFGHPYSRVQLFNPRNNARVAYTLSRGGTSWRTHWVLCG